MIPVLSPSLLIRPLRIDETPLVGHAINSLLRNTPYSTPMEETELKDQLLHSQPPTLYQARWQRHLRLCAWRAGELEGFLDAATGFDQESLDLPEYRPIGLLRFLVLPGKPELLQEVTTALLSAAEDFWRGAGIGYVKAFHMSTGYPSFQAGLGVLPSDWTAHIRVLTGADFRFCERFYCLRRALDQPLEEVTPLAQLSVVQRGKLNDRHYQVYRQTEWIAAARITNLILTSTHLREQMRTGQAYAQMRAGEAYTEMRASEEERTVRVANLVDLRVAPEWRQKDIGKWLLRRVINDAIMQGYHQMLVHVPHRAHVAFNLFNQIGFQEENYRGYTLEKALTK
jgi:GNAT superfamily N-acetyltransferase